MINKTLRRLAVGASAITVAGVLVPLAAATTASAAATPTLSVTPTSANTTTSNTVTYTVTPTPSTPTNGVSFDVYSGPDTNTAAPFAGTACTTGDGGVTYSCVLNTGTTPGTDKIHFYEPAAAGAAYATADPSVDGTAVVAGAVNTVTISPVGGSEAQGVYQMYTVTATDSAGRPVPGAAVSLTETQSNATSTDLGIGFNTTGKRNTSFFGAGAATTGGNGSRTANTTTADGTGAQAAGTATFNATSKVTGTLNLTAFLTGTPATSSNTTLTIDPGTANDVTSVVLTPPSANAFTGKTVTETATLKNTQGDLVGGVTPSGFVTGANTGAAVTPSGATDGTGTATLSYTATNAGTDTLTGFVNQTGHAVNTGGLDSGEPSGTATITVAAQPAGTTLSDSYPGHTDTVPTTTGTTNVTFTLTATSGPLSGYTVNFSTPTSTKYSLGSTSGTTNAQGQVTVAVTNNNPTNGDSVAVTATLQGDSTKTDTVTVDYSAPATSEVIIEPYAGVSPVGGTSATFKATAYDQFGSPISTGLTYQWSVNGRNTPANNLTATGTGQTFSYTDAGPSSSGGTDTVTVTVSDATPSVVGSDSVQQEFVLGTAKAAQANIDLGTANGDYTANGPGGTAPFVPTGFTKSATAPVSPDYTPANVDLTEVNVRLADANGDPLQGKSVSFSSSGVGQFFTYNPQTGDYDIASGSTATALVDPCDAGNGDPCNNTNYATVYVASTSPGTQTITASVDGVTDTATVTYSGNYIAVTPERIVDTRNGQGDMQTYQGTSAKGGLSQDTNYFFDLSSTDAPQGADAYVFNVTAIGATKPGNLRIQPDCGTGSTPTTSLINYQPGKDVANSIVIPNTSHCDEFDFFSAGSPVNVAVDLQGYYASNGNAEFKGITPARLADTRNSGGAVAANTSRSFQVTGTAGIPANARAVALNVTAIGPNGLGNLRVYPDGGTVPTTSNINYIPGVDKAAFVVIQVPANGKIDVYSAGSPVNVAIDAFGYYPAGSTVVTQAPVRVFDSRSGVELKAGVPVDLPVTTPGATNGVPANAQAVLVSLTAIHAADSTGVGNLRAYPAGQPTPTVSNINYVSKTSDVANFAIVPVGANGKITLYSAGSNINATVDILGYVPAGV